MTRGTLERSKSKVELARKAVDYYVSIDKNILLPDLIAKFNISEYFLRKEMKRMKIEVKMVYRSREISPVVYEAARYFLFTSKGDMTIKEVAKQYDVNKNHLEITIEKMLTP